MRPNNDHKPISIAIELNPDQEARRTIQKGLFDANVMATSDGHFDAICVTACDATSVFIGGVLGEAYWGWVNFTTKIEIYRKEVALSCCNAPVGGSVCMH